MRTEVGELADTDAMGSVGKKVAKAAKVKIDRFDNMQFLLQDGWPRRGRMGAGAGGGGGGAR